MQVRYLASFDLRISIVPIYMFFFLLLRSIENCIFKARYDILNGRDLTEDIS